MGKGCKVATKRKYFWGYFLLNHAHHATNLLTRLRMLSGIIGFRNNSFSSTWHDVICGI